METIILVKRLLLMIDKRYVIKFVFKWKVKRNFGTAVGSVRVKSCSMADLK